MLPKQQESLCPNQTSQIQKTHVRRAGVRLEEASDANGVLLLLLHADVHRLDASQQQPRVERTEAGALGVLEEVDLQKTTKRKHACVSRD